MGILRLLPLNLIPVLVAAAGILGALPEFAVGAWHRERWMTPICDSWFVLGPVLVLAALAPGQASLADAEVYLLAFAGQLAADACWWLLRDKLLLGGAARGTFQTSLETSRVDATLAPIGFIVGLAAADEPLALLAVAPLIWLLQAFSRSEQRATAPPLSSTAPTTARSRLVRRHRVRRRLCRRSLALSRGPGPLRGREDGP